MRVCIEVNSRGREQQYYRSHFPIYIMVLQDNRDGPFSSMQREKFIHVMNGYGIIVVPTRANRKYIVLTRRSLMKWRSKVMGK